MTDDWSRLVHLRPGMCVYPPGPAHRSDCPDPDSRPATPKPVEPAGERFPAGLAEDEVLLLKLIARDRRRDRVRRLWKRLRTVTIGDRTTPDSGPDTDGAKQ